METRVTIVANSVKETVKKTKAQNRRRKTSEEDDINNMSNSKYLQQYSIKIMNNKARLKILGLGSPRSRTSLLRKPPTKINPNRRRRG